MSDPKNTTETPPLDQHPTCSEPERPQCFAGFIGALVDEFKKSAASYREQGKTMPDDLKQSFEDRAMMNDVAADLVIEMTNDHIHRVSNWKAWKEVQNAEALTPDGGERNQHEKKTSYE